MLHYSCFVLVFVISVVSGSPECSKYDFPCENGGCIDSVLWCDSHVDCVDGSDERYCKKAELLNKNPNKCPPIYFKCRDGPCIPMIGRCDGYEDCRDFSDEEHCGILGTFTSSSTFRPTIIENLPTQMGDASSDPTTSVTTNGTTLQMTEIATTHQPPVEEPRMYQSDSFERNQYSVQNVYSDFHSSDYSKQREKAWNWLFSQKDGNFGWGAETPRAITALYLSDVQQSIKKNENGLLMVKQLEVELSLDLARNGSKLMKLTELALYINALLATCKDPDNFYGENLIQTLRNGVDAAQGAGTFVNPAVYLTLCLNNATTYYDTRKLHDVISSRNASLNRIDIQSLALLAATCINRSTSFLTMSIYEGFKNMFSQNVKVKGFPGNVYESSILFQALQEMSLTVPGLLEFILSQQQEDGAFGDILSTYLVLPVLAGRSFLQMNDHCSQKSTSDIAPIEVLKNAKRKKIYVQYSLNYGNPPEVTQTIQMQVAEGITFFDVMRLAQEINPKYRFKLDTKGENPVVYSIGGIPNDAEKGMLWTLHLSSNSNIVGRDLGRLSPYTGNIKKLRVNANDEYVFWMKSI